MDALINIFLILNLCAFMNCNIVNPSQSALSPTPLDTKTASRNRSAVPSKPFVEIEGGTDIFTTAGVPIELLCTATGNPLPTVTWVNPESFQTIDSEVRNITDGFTARLKLDFVEKNTTYICMAANIVGSDSTHSNVLIKYEEKEPPKFLNHKNLTQFVYIGGNLDLPCTATGKPEPEIVWYRDEQVISFDDKTGIVKFEDIHLHDSGLYRCQASNAFGVINMTYNVTVLEEDAAPIIEKDRWKIYAEEGDNVALPCLLAQGYPEPTYHWSFTGPSQRSVTLKEQSHVIHLNGIKCKDGGRYICMVENASGKDHKVINVYVNCPPVFSNVCDSIVEVLTNNTAHLSCIATGTPAPSIEWLYKGHSLPTHGSRYYIHSKKIEDGFQSTLRFTAHSSDSGQFTCRAKNKHGAKDKTYTVTVNELPYIEPPKQSMYSVNTYGDLNLECKVSGSPTPTVKWIFWTDDGKLEKGILLEKSKPDGSLHLRQIQAKQEGHYTCFASNRAGTTSITYDLTVNGGPEITSEKIDYDAVVGDLALQVPCLAAGSPKPAVRWFQKFENNTNVLLPSGSLFYHIFYEDYTLVLKNITKASGGNFICEASNEHNTTTKEFKVKIKSFPDHKQPADKTITVVEGDRFTFTCPTDLKAIDQIRWYRNDRLIAANNYTKPSLRFKDEGLYLCRVSNVVESLTASMQLVVNQRD